MNVRCACYVRLSTDDQRDNGYSIDAQLRMIQEYYEKNEYAIVDVYNDEFITKSSKAYLKYLNEIMMNNNIWIKYKDKIDKEKLKNMELDYDILSLTKMKNNKYSNEFLDDFITNAKEHLYVDAIISCPYVGYDTVKDVLIFVPKNAIKNETV